MSNIGKIKALYISLADKTREEKEQIDLDEQGIINDKFHAKGVERSILISSIDSYELAKENDIDIEYGYLGENILLDINPYGLSSGDKIKIGSSVVLEITQNCTICNSLGKVYKNLPNLLKSDRGIFAKTIQSGNINKGDRVEVVID